ncbi:PIN domain-like protein [Jaminaea rosea]|uniref:PIN domain-like protein n=1 Tax=Jaminaea rosea TaxID=1569628 RepID=A0A316UZY8_9BASI|nr:PIN domain-like protein [Jaminaea rosea]PWN30856.1 PIN domain-like protein [Jaminaea rosea]
MGVQGLWSLLQPAARPIKLEDLEGKRFAVDSSIWLYHFRMAMRDKEGRTLSNAHILGFFWRICKLLHFGLRPVFVFDGGAPVMKRQTLIGRKNRRQGAKESHALAAKKLLNAQLRQAALEHVAVGSGGGSSSRQGNADADGDNDEGTGMGSNVVYLDDYGGSSNAAAGPSRPAAPPQQARLDGSSSASPSKEGAAKKKKNIDYHRDPYALPNLDQDLNTVTASTSASGSGRGEAAGSKKGRRQDFRFATDAELRHLVSSITPSDIDMSSPLFRSLPFELQYELVGDMRAASRGTSYKRLQSMLQTSPTAIDFSKAQIQNLKTRNELTQRVLDVTDEIGDAHIKVPIRVAGERNREYVLVRKGGDETGFVLGVRNQEGTSKEKAIVVGSNEQVDVSSDEEDDEEDSFEQRRRQLARKNYRDEDDDIELDEVEVPHQSTSASPRKSVSQSPSSLNAFRPSDANNPDVRRALAEQILSRRAEEHIREKMRERGIVNEDEVLEEQLKAARQRLKEGGKAADLFPGVGRGDKSSRASASGSVGGDAAIATALAAYYENDGDEASADETDDDAGVEIAEMTQDLSATERRTRRVQRPANGETIAISDDDEAGSLDDVDADVPLESFSADQYAGALGETGTADQPSEGFSVDDYASAYGGGGNVDQTAADEENIEMEDVQPEASAAREQDDTAIREKESTLRPSGDPSGPVLGFRRSDRPGLPGRLDPKLFERRKWYDGQAEEEEDVPGQSSKSPSKMSSVASPAKSLASEVTHPRIKQSESPSPLKRPPGAPAKKAAMSSSPLKTSAAHPRGKMADSPSQLKATPLRASPSKLPPADLVFKKPEARSIKPALKDQQPEIGTTKTKTDEAGRAEPDMEPLPKNDDLAATAMLNDHSPRASAELEQKGEQKNSPASPAAAEVVDAPAAPGPAVNLPSDKLAQAAAGVEEEEITAPSPLQSGEQEKEMSEASGKTTVSPTQASGAQASRSSSLSPIPANATLDNDVSTVKERGKVAEVSPQRRRSPSLDSDGGSPIEWSASPSPEPPTLGADGFPLPTAEELEQMDVEYEEEAQAMRADQSDIAAFISNTKGQGLIEAQAQLAREVQALKAEHVNTKKSEEEITRQMASEIQLMLRLFGLPYITAPMEAEAQCAELVSQKLVDGIITDDSDVFLFGGTRVYKNMFNNNKVVECFLLSDIQRELGLDREKLVRLAYLLGSDYTEGLPSVGPVVAMEVLSLFTGPDGLLRFKDWWMKVQSGRDTPDDTRGKTMRRIKKTLANKVHLSEDWPNAKVLDAYYEPEVDSSDEPFQWGLPDLDNLRTYLGEYLGWPTTKTDQYVVPVIEAQSRRSRARGGANQSTLDRNGFFDVSAGTGVYAGRQLPKYGSSRLQNVVDGFRQANKRAAAAAPASTSPAKGDAGAQGDGDDFEVIAGPSDASTRAQHVPEEKIGKAMGASRPIVRREQMRTTKRDAQRELDANIAALEGEGADKAEATAGAKGKGKGGRQRTKRGRKTAQQDVEDEEETMSSDTSSEEDNDEDGDQEYVASSKGKQRQTVGGKKGATTARGRGRGAARGHSGVARGRGRGRGRGGAAAASGGSAAGAGDDDEDRAASAPADDGDATASPGETGAEAPAKKRQRRSGPRESALTVPQQHERRQRKHPHLHAGRTMRLDGPMPESIGEPLGRPRRASSSTSGGSSRSRSGSVHSPMRSASNSTSRPGMQRTGSSRRIEIELRSDEEDEE